MSPSVSVIVVNWNGRHFLQTCLTSLQGQNFTNVELILVDNGSQDGSVSYVRTHFPQVRLIPLQKNTGFATANNIGMRASTAEYVVLINNDTRADPNLLTALVTAAEAEPQVGMCAAKMLFFDQPQMINSTGICLDRAGIAWDRQGGMPDTKAGALPGPPERVFGASGGAALYRRAMLEKIGLFDEMFFAYLEDVDLAWRAQLAGWRCLYVPGAVIYHHHSATAVDGSSFKNRLLGRNKIWMILKNYPLPGLFWYAPLIAAYDLGSVLVALVVRRDVSPLVGRLLALPHLAEMLRRRRAIQEKRLLSNRQVLAKMEPVARPDRVWRRYRHLSRTVENRPTA